MRKVERYGHYITKNSFRTTGLVFPSLVRKVALYALGTKTTICISKIFWWLMVKVFVNSMIMERCTFNLILFYHKKIMIQKPLLDIFFPQIISSAFKNIIHIRENSYLLNTKRAFTCSRVENDINEFIICFKDGIL